MAQVQFLLDAKAPGILDLKVMKMVWNPNRHEDLVHSKWDKCIALDFLSSVALDAVDIYKNRGGWPVDARDLMEGMPDDQANSLYYGAAGNVWALQRLEKALQVKLPMDPRAAAYRTYERSQEHPDSKDPGFIISKGGSELLAYAFGFDEAAEALTRSIDACGVLDQPKELFWGPPASLLMAYHAYQLKKDPHWLNLFLCHGQKFLAEFGLEKHEVWQWPQLLYDAERPCIIGAAHGLVGAMLPFMLAYEYLPQKMQERMFTKLVLAIQDTAVETDVFANWPKSLPLAETDDLLLQWCHGAPGIVSSLSHLPQPYLDSIIHLLKKAGEAIWSAGPLIKPAGLCHGTAGNAYALLRLHSITGDEIWLERARLFGMHAIAQSQAERQRKGQWHYSLLTGDMGLAVFLADCLLGSRGHLPVIESFAFSV